MIRHRSAKTGALNLRDTYTTEKARSDLVCHLWVYLVLRPVSFHLTSALIRIGVSANLCTLAGFIFLVSGMALVLLGFMSNVNLVLGAVLLNVWYLFDVIDGNIARFQGQDSKFGALLDWFVGMVYATLLPVCLGVALYLISLSRDVFDFGLGLPNWAWLAVGGVDSFSHLLRNIVSMQGRTILGEPSTYAVNAEVSIGAIIPRAILSFRLPLFLVASVLGCLGALFILYSGYNLASFLAVVFVFFRKARIADRNRSREKEQPQPPDTASRPCPSPATTFTQRPMERHDRARGSS